MEFVETTHGMKTCSNDTCNKQKIITNKPLWYIYDYIIIDTEITF